MIFHLESIHHGNSIARREINSVLKLHLVDIYTFLIYEQIPAMIVEWITFFFIFLFLSRFASFLEALAGQSWKRDKISFTVTDLPLVRGQASNKNNHIAGEQSDVESFRAIQFTYIYMYSIYIYIYVYTVRFQT